MSLRVRGLLPRCCTARRMKAGEVTTARRINARKLVCAFIFPGRCRTPIQELQRTACASRWRDPGMHVQQWTRCAMVIRTGGGKERKNAIASLA